MRCEGWTRHGGAFSFGPTSWSQCENDAIVMLRVQQEGKVENLPACKACWIKGKKNNIMILSVIPIEEEK